MTNFKNFLLLLITISIGSCNPRLQQELKESDIPVSDIETIAHTIPGTAISFEMTLVPAGEFMLGSPEGEKGRREDEGPPVQVKLESFWIGTYELKYEAYNIFREKELDKIPTEGNIEWNPDAITRPSPPYNDPTFGMGKEGFPAVSMTQFAALQYCKWLSDKTGIFFRLPTEAEWEYACRAGSQTAYSFGNQAQKLDDFAWHEGNSGEKYLPTGGKQPNAWGLYDMHGNVSEWTLDQYDDNFYTQLNVQGSPVIVPWNTPTKLHPRTVKGGSWDDPAENHRCACRIKSSMQWKKGDPQIPKSFWWNTDSPFVGFRIISPYNQPTKEEQKAFWNTVFGG